MRFVHMSDVHLGCTRYNLQESPRDFFDSWMSVIRNYVLDNDVDFVIICGDFFHKKVVPPETMNYAIEGLTMIRNAQIPVVMIEGNHDQTPTDNEFSWIRSLSSWGFVKLLEPRVENGVAIYDEWDEDSKRGGYIDIGQARIFGSEWYGASGNYAIPALVDSIKLCQREGAFHMLMLHTDVEGYQTHPIPAINVATLSELKKVVQYVGLGHTHMHYEIDNWAFNPGSIEVTDVSQFKETRGIFVVDVDKDNNVSAEHMQDYTYREFQRLSFDVSQCLGPLEVTEQVLDLVERKAQKAEEGKPEPILEITLVGLLEFPNSLLEIKRISELAKAETCSLAVRVKNKTAPSKDIVQDYRPENQERAVVEKKVISDLVARDKRFRDKSDVFVAMVLGAKHMVLDGDEAEDIAGFIALKVEESGYKKK